MPDASHWPQLGFIASSWLFFSCRCFSSVSQALSSPEDIEENQRKSLLTESLLTIPATEIYYHPTYKRQSDVEALSRSDPKSRTWWSKAPAAGNRAKWPRAGLTFLGVLCCGKETLETKEYAAAADYLGPAITPFYSSSFVILLHLLLSWHETRKTKIK